MFGLKFGFLVNNCIYIATWICLESKIWSKHDPQKNEKNKNPSPVWRYERIQNIHRGSLFPTKLGLHTTHTSFWLYLQILKSIGLHGGQHVNNLRCRKINVLIRSWGEHRAIHISLMHHTSNGRSVTKRGQCTMWLWYAAILLWRVLTPIPRQVEKGQCLEMCLNATRHVFFGFLQMPFNAVKGGVQGSKVDSRFHYIFDEKPRTTVTTLFMLGHRSQVAGMMYIGPFDWLNKNKNTAYRDPYNAQGMGRPAKDHSTQPWTAPLGRWRGRSAGEWRSDDFVCWRMLSSTICRGCSEK